MNAIKIYQKVFAFLLLFLVVIQNTFNLRLNWKTHLGNLSTVFSSVSEQLSYPFTNYFSHFVMLFCFALGSWALGRTFFKIFKWNFDYPEEKTIFPAGMGMGLISFLTFLLTCLHLLNQELFMAILVLPTLYSLYLIFFEEKPSLSAVVSIFSFSRKNMISSICLYLFLLACLSLAVLAALEPPYFFDKLVYHLAVPNQYIRFGGMTNTSSNLYSAFPMGWSMLYLFMMVIKDEILAQLINVLAIAGFFLIFKSFEKRSGPSDSEEINPLLALTIFLSLPIVISDSLWGGAELGWCFFQLLGVYSSFAYAHSSGEKKQWLYLSAIFSGFALTTKYLAFISVAANLGYLLYAEKIILKRPVKSLLKSSLIYGGIAALIYLPWGLKNLYYFHNPVYPLLANHLPPPEPGLDLPRFLADGKQVQIGSSFSISNLYETFIKAFVPIYQTKASGYMGTPILICIAAVLLYPFSSMSILAIVYGLLYWIMLATNTTQVRFFIPGLAILVLAGSRIPSDISSRKILKVIYFASWFVTFGVQWLATAGPVIEADGWKVVFGLQSRSEYLSEAHELGGYRNPYFAATEVFHNLPSHSRILFLGETRTFFSPLPTLASSAFDQQLISKWANASKNSEDLYSKIKKEGIIYLYLNIAEAYLIRVNYDNFKWTNQGIDVFNQFWNDHIVEISLQNVYTKQQIPQMHLYQLVQDRMVYSKVPFPNHLLEMEKYVQSSAGSVQTH